MPISPDWAYFDHAAVAPLPRPAVQQMGQWAEQTARQGDVPWTDWQRRCEALRERAAQLINARADEIALVPNTTFGINLVADGLDWQSGDNVVMPEGEFPSNVYPWMALQKQGVEIRQVPRDGDRVDLNRIAETCDSRTRVVTASWIGFSTGYRIDPQALAQVAHDQGAWCFLDAIQGLGVFPLDVQQAGIDFLAADGHKWMLGPEGAGLFFVRHDRLPELRPMNVGWNSVAHGNQFSQIDFQLRESAARYEGGTQNVVGMVGLGASLELLAEHGLSCHRSPIADRVLDLTDRICQALAGIGAEVLSDRYGEARSGIVSFDYHGLTTHETRKQLIQSSRVVLSSRGGRLRVAPHAYNDDNDIDRLVEGLKRLA